MTEFVAFHKEKSALPVKGDTIQIQGAPPPDSLRCVSNYVKFSSVADLNQECPNPPRVGYNGVADTVTDLGQEGIYHFVLVKSNP